MGRSLLPRMLPSRIRFASAEEAAAIVLQIEVILTREPCTFGISAAHVFIVEPHTGLLRLLRAYLADTFQVLVRADQQAGGDPADITTGGFFSGFRSRNR